MRILFVDDETHILRSIQRLMIRRSYTTFYAASGSEALQLLETQPVDAVVSDMIMPEMNGYDLLLKIRNTQPAVARIIVSGYAQMELIQHAVMQGVAAAYLLKPLNVETLMTVLEQCRGVGESLADGRVRDVVLSTGLLPMFADTRERILQAVQGGMDAAEMERTIESDLSVTVNVLRLANSVSHGRAIRVGSVKEAVIRIGGAAVKAIVQDASVINEACLSPAAVIRIRAIGANSVKINRLTQVLCHQITGASISDNDRLLGLVHDIGALLMEARMPELMARMVAVCGAGMAGIDAERQVFAADHAQIGGSLLDYWSFPTMLASVARYHHVPLQEHISGEGKMLLSLLHMVDRFVWRKDERHPVLHSMPEDERVYAYVGKSKTWVMEILNHEYETR
jgi:CheY-like chemotaxis protein